jgi:hypothetical protein
LAQSAQNETKETIMKKSLFAFALSLCLAAPALAEETAQAPAATDAAKPAKGHKKAKADPGTPVAEKAGDAPKDAAPKDEAKPAKAAKKGKAKKAEEKKPE